MIRFGRTSQTAVSAMSCLAEAFEAGRKLSSADVARDRNLPQPLVAKVLTVLSTAGLVCGARGPGGGYLLARPPGEITLSEIVEAFERDGEGPMCPFGPGWCGTGEPCPVHDSFEAIGRDLAKFLKGTTLAVFTEVPKVAAGRNLAKAACGAQARAAAVAGRDVRGRRAG